MSIWNNKAIAQLPEKDSCSIYLTKGAQDATHFVRQAKSIHVQAPEGFAYSLDGEIIYENDFTVEIAAAALNLAVPE